MYVYICMYLLMSACVCGRGYIRVYMCLFVYGCTYMYMYIYVYVHDLVLIYVYV